MRNLLFTLVLVASQVAGRLLPPVPLPVHAPIPRSVPRSIRQGQAEGISSPSSNGSYAPGVAFSPCPDMKPFQPANTRLFNTLLCANISVPLNDADPFGPQVQLGLVKLVKSGNAPRIGNLFVNPGGPGSPASTMVWNIARGALPVGDVMLDQYDIIGMDPRGVGLSSPVKCDTTLANLPSNFDAVVPDGFQAMVAYNKALGESCRNLTGPVFDQMDTVAVAKDLERVRVALGNEPMNFFGQSYGAQLAQQYAMLFPGNVRAMVLDGVLSHSGNGAENILIQSTSLDQTIQAFFRECEDSPVTRCGLPNPTLTNTTINLRQVWERVIDLAGSGDLRAPGCDGTPATGCYPNVTVSSVLGTTRSYLEVPTLHRRLAQGLLLAASGNGTFFADGLLTGDTFTDSQFYSIQTVQCQDGWFVSASSPEQVQGIALQTRTFTSTPGMGEFWNRVIGCTGYPVQVTNPRQRLKVKGMPNPVLIVHSRYDPATSMVYAQIMNEEIEGSVLVVRDGISHTSYFLQGETASVVDQYLTNLTVPGPGTVLFG